MCLDKIAIEMARRKLVVIGLLGTKLDVGRDNRRWDRWRPSVALTQHEDLLVDRFELIHNKHCRDLAATVSADVAHVSPETKLVKHELEFADPWDFEGVYEKLRAFTEGYAFDVEREDYLVHITTGTHVAQICLFLLTESRYFPARLLQTSPVRTVMVLSNRVAKLSSISISPSTTSSQRAFRRRRPKHTRS